MQLRHAENYISHSASSISRLPRYFHATKLKKFWDPGARYTEYISYTAAFQCPELFDIPNGEVEFSSRTPGSTATYTCDFGFVLQGDEQRVCMENETWSGEPPTCLRKFKFHSYYPIPDIPFLFLVSIFCRDNMS